MWINLQNVHGYVTGKTDPLSLGETVYHHSVSHPPWVIHRQLCDVAVGIEPIRMGYLRCEACGAKALSAASQCPKCAHLFELRDARGERVALKTCRHCGIMHRRDRHCQWCVDRVRTADTTNWMRRIDGRALGGIAAVALVAVGGYAVIRAGGPMVARVAAAATASTPTPTLTAESRQSPEVTAGASLAGRSVGAELPSQTSAAVGTMDSVQLASATMTALEGDTITWVPAVARTWVNVRRDAARAGDVVGVIKPSEKAMLGTGRGGWRLVKSPDVRGWVDPRLFEADSSRTRG